MCKVHKVGAVGDSSFRGSNVVRSAGSFEQSDMFS